MKVCCLCKEVCPAAAFWKAKATRDGLQTACRPCQKGKDKEWRENNSLRKRWIQLKNGAKRRGVNFNLSWERFVQIFSVKTCPGCGVVLVLNKYPTKSASGASYSVDRIDPTIGYEDENCMVLCLRCNRIKQDATPYQLRRLADWLEAISPPQPLVEQFLSNYGVEVCATA